jgi:hypothetical protein
MRPDRLPPNAGHTRGDCAELKLQSANDPIADISRKGQTAAVDSFANGQTVSIACPHCGQAGHADFGQSVPDGKLRWYCSVRCPVAGNFEEDGDGIDDAPSDLRNELLAAKGAWSVRADEGEKLKAIATTKRLLSVPLAEMAALLQSFPTLFIGTKAEADWLAETLTREDITAAVTKSVPNGS